MRTFITLSCLATVYAASLGYNYEREYDVVPTDGEQVYKAGQFDGNVYSAPTEYSKQFFSYSAPKDAFDDNTAQPKLSSTFKRNLRVIFIRAPENSGLKNAALQLAKSVGDQRSAIYVFKKQTDLGDLANKLNALNKNANNKPEVTFVKYRTPADAESAQRAIQNQYEALGGKSSSQNGGVAPVLNFASKYPEGTVYRTTEPSSSYLPVNKRV